MNTEPTLLQAIHAAPEDDLAWLALADWLEEHGQSDRAELLRLHRALRQVLRGAEKNAGKERLRALLASGVRPCVPTLTNSVGMTFALIPPGTFLMGAPKEESVYDNSDELPHEVEITRAFYLGTCPVTQEQYEKVTGRLPAYVYYSLHGKGRREVVGLDTRTFPMDNVSWNSASAFCGKLAKLLEEKRAGRQYRLPTEAEWEYACRGGDFPGPEGFDIVAPSGQANEGARLYRTRPVGASPPNPFGLYDMQGNVSHWVNDWYDGGYYRDSPRQGPQGPAEGTMRTLRGNAAYHPAFGPPPRVAHRGRNAPRAQAQFYGFRVVLVP